MKKLYHLFVTRYELHVTSYKLQIERFKRFTSHLLPLTSYLIPLTAFLFLPFAALAQATVTMEAEVTNVVFSCPGSITVTYNLIACDPVDVTLRYSSDKCNWAAAQTVSGAGSTSGQTTGRNKTIVWDNETDGAKFGKYYFKIDYEVSAPLPEPDPVLINGVYWAPVNLDVWGWFAADPTHFGGLYQWGRRADGHECRTSPCYSGACGTANNSALNASNLDANGQPSVASGAIGYFIKQNAEPRDWRTPQCDTLWTHSNGDKTINDPCPAGWRVPTCDEMSTLIDPSVTQTLTTNYLGSGINGFLFSEGGNSIFLPFNSIRAFEGSINTAAENRRGTYWTSTLDATSAYSCMMDISDYSSPPISFWPAERHANGYGIRCVHE